MSLIKLKEIQEKYFSGEEGYLNVMEHILDNGYETGDRTGTGTIVSPTPHQLYFKNVAERFPLFTTKYVSFNMLAVEMLWFISGSTNTKDLEQMGSPSMAKMWNNWADDDGELGPVYGSQWRKWRTYNSENFLDDSDDFIGYKEIDQLTKAIDKIKNNPGSRRIRVSAWNPVDVENMALPPCHFDYQFTCEPISSFERTKLAGGRDTSNRDNYQDYLDEEGIPKYKLHLHMTQRSCDMFLGVPFNVAQYALLLMLVAKVTKTVPGDFTWTGINCHIYQDHLEAVQRQLSRRPKDLPKVEIADLDDIDKFTREDMLLTNYEHHPKIKAKVSV